MKPLARIFSVLLILAFLMTACSPATQPAQPTQPSAESGKKQYTICFAFQDLETEFWMAGHKAITETLKTRGITVLSSQKPHPVKPAVKYSRSSSKNDRDVIE
jgi:inositol transport system substrate-binding protein